MLFAVEFAVDTVYQNKEIPLYSQLANSFVITIE
jgi:hypothetical protein